MEWMKPRRRKSSGTIQTPILSAVAILSAGIATGCGGSTPPVNVYLDASGQCISEASGRVVEQRICYGHGGGYYGGAHYMYLPMRSAPYYSNPGSAGYVRPWGGGAGGAVGAAAAGAVIGGGTVRGAFGGAAGGGA